MVALRQRPEQQARTRFEKVRVGGKSGVSTRGGSYF